MTGWACSDGMFLVPVWGYQNEPSQDYGGSRYACHCRRIGLCRDLQFRGSSGDSSSKSFTVDGITAVATAFREGPLGFLQFAGNVSQNGSGLGVSSFPDTSGEIDGFGLKDTLVLTFDQLVSFSLAYFGAVDRKGSDDWDIYVDDGSGSFVQVANDITDNPFNFAAAREAHRVRRRWPERRLPPGRLSRSRPCRCPPAAGC